MGNSKGKKVAKKYIGKPLPTVEAVVPDATKINKAPIQKKQVGNYKKVDSTIADAIKNVVLPGWLPDNAKQLAAKLLGDARMSNSSLNDEQKVLLWDVIQNAKKRTGKADGGTEYEDYGGLGYGSSEDFNKWWNKGGVTTDNVLKSFTNPGYELSSTIGRGRYWSDPEDPNKMYYTDVYDWNPSEKNFPGSNLYQIARNALRNNEDKNLNKEKNENYRMNFELNAADIEKIREKRNRPSEYYLDRNGGWLEKYNDGGPVQENYNDYSVSAPEGYVGDGYSNVGRDYSPAWGGQFKDGGELPNVTVKGKRQPIIVTDPNDPRLRAYQDSLTLYNISKDAEAKLAKITANAYKKSGFDKSSINEALFEGKDIVLHPEKYLGKGSFDFLKKYNKKGLYYESEPGEEYLGTPQSPATIQNLIKYNKQDIKERTPYINSLDEDVNGHTNRDRIEAAKVASDALQKEYEIVKRTGYNPTYFIPNAERSPNLIFKKPTQPIILQERVYQKETPELQDLQAGIPVNIPLPELHRQAGPNRITMGKPLFPGGPQTDYYTPIDEAGNVVQSPEFKTSQFAMGGSMPGAVGFMYARTNDPAPSNGPYAKKTKASAKNGEELKKGVKTVYSGMLPEITVVGSKDPQTEEYYRTILDRLTKEEGYANGIPSDDPVYNDPKSVDMVYNYPNATDNILGRYEGLMDLGKKYGFPKVHPKDPNSIFAIAKKLSDGELYLTPPANYNPLTKTIQASTSHDWVNELAHHVQFKNSPISTAFKFLGNDVPAYFSENSPYVTPGTMENEAHSIIEPKLEKEIERSKSKNYRNLPYIQKKADEFYGDDFYKGLGAYQNGGEMKYYQQGLDFKPKTISRDGSQLVKLDQLLNFTNYNTKQPGGWLDKYEG